MSADVSTLNQAIRTLLQADGKMGTTTLVAQLQSLGFTSLPEIWKALEQLERMGEVRGGGPAVRRTWELMPPPQAPGRRERPAPPAPAPPPPSLPDLEDPALFLNLAPAPPPARILREAEPVPSRQANSPAPALTSGATPTPPPPASPSSAPSVASPPTSPSPAPSVASPTAPIVVRRRGGGRRREDKQVQHKGLTRCDYPERHMVGYMVRVTWAGVRRQKFFADNKHGDRLGALAAALDWRDQQERELGKPRTEQLIIGKAASNTGIPGVTRLIRAGHPILQVTWYENGRQRRTSISIDKHGERAALALARRIRAEAEQRRLGRTARVVLATIQH